MVEVIEWGDGPPVVMVHGDVLDAELLFGPQRPLAERHRLRLVNRRGFGNSPPTEREDFEVDAVDVAEALGDGAHLVGHSYGGVVALLAAARRPEAVWSLAVVEPPAFGLVADRPEVREFVVRFHELLAADLSPEAFLAEFVRLVGGDPNFPQPLPPPILQGVKVLQHCRPPDEAQIPLDALARLPGPRLVVSGGHSAAFDAVCDVLEVRLGADRVVLRGAGHRVNMLGEPFNAALERHWARAPAAAGSA